MIEVGQLRRWTWRSSPLPVAWEGKMFLMIDEDHRWIDRGGGRHSDWSFIIDGGLETGWRDADIEKFSEVISEEG